MGFTLENYDAVGRFRVAERDRPIDATGFYRTLGGEEIQFHGARELIAALRAAGVPLAIATGKSHLGLRRALESAGLSDAFSATRCADQTHPKPHPAMLLELADELMVAPERTLMVGDTTHDLQMAAAANAAAVGMTQGAHPLEQLAACRPLALFDSLAELHRWLMPER